MSVLEAKDRLGQNYCRIDPYKVGDFYRAMPDKKGGLPRKYFMNFMN